MSAEEPVQYVVDANALESADDALRTALEGAYEIGGAAHKAGYTAQRALLGDVLFENVLNLGRLKHAARGVAVTLLGYKVIKPSQDVRRHKAELAGGFSARSIDTRVTVPFLQSLSLYYNVQSHWLSQTFAFAGAYVRDAIPKTTPKRAGVLLIDVLNGVEEAPDAQIAAQAALEVILGELIDERSRGKVALEKPKDLPIEDVVELLQKHFAFGYEKNAPRLPQIAMYAIYRVLTQAVERYSGFELQPLERMKTANRKSGSVGDVDVNFRGQPVEAVEVKFGVPVSKEHVAEAIQKITTASVERYFILSTSGVKESDEMEIRTLRREFRRRNGCEIIVNGVLDSIGYYLRLLRSTTDFVVAYTVLVEEDPDVGYEHRIAWNKVCSERSVGS